ncbi:inositol monophosphatase family protein [Desemzia sp. RIT804]|nr:inositol monophosphatase family protein [Desemzia sp. RIT 804]
MRGCNKLNQVEKRNQLITEWILEAGEKIKDSFKETIQVEQKTNRNDLVTEMDKKTEKQLTENIQQYFPGERIFAEESNNKDIQDLSGIVWIIDPIDGTLNFVKQQNDFAIMVAVYEDGIGQMSYIYDVMKGELYTAIKDKGVSCNGQPIEKAQDIALENGLVAISSPLLSGDNDAVRKIGRKSNGVRMVGSAGLETVYASTGRIVAYIAASLAPWDIAAGKLIAEELGLVYTQHNGRKVDLLQKNPVIVATPTAHETIVEMLTQKV